MTIRRLLVPNRGEIAVRIARTCREMGVVPILAHAADDVSGPALRAFKDFELLGSGEARDTYLNIAAVIDAARRSSADAVHPGYGFLSERAELAAACEEAGIRFVGPPSEAIAAMGSKAGARELMRRAGVPVVPGYDGENQSDERLLSEALRIGFPLLVKASAGGGGKGMRAVHEEGELRSAIESARREAERSFGNGRLLLEKLIERPRHVEFQIFGDSSGRVVHLFERDCSLQRRHQKVVEETPAPRFSDDLRTRMGEAAVRAAEAVGYRNAGTVEFILAEDESFYFLEMNTRLQVEHPVTELVLGVDLVRAQIETADGRSPGFDAGSLRQKGHAIEVRLYAEDPAGGYLPQAGRIEWWNAPSGPGVRVDAGIESGSEVTVHYDPMLAKIITYGADRNETIRRMVRALEETAVVGIRTNREWLRRVVASDEFASGEVSTAFLDEHAGRFTAASPDETAAAIAALLLQPRQPGASASAGAGILPVEQLVGEWGRG